MQLIKFLLDFDVLLDSINDSNSTSATRLCCWGVLLSCNQAVLLKCTELSCWSDLHPSNSSVKRLSNTDELIRCDTAELLGCKSLQQLSSVHFSNTAWLQDSSTPQQHSLVADVEFESMIESSNTSKSNKDSSSDSLILTLLQFKPSQQNPSNLEQGFKCHRFMSSSVPTRILHSPFKIRVLWSGCIGYTVAMIITLILFCQLLRSNRKIFKTHPQNDFDLCGNSWYCIIVGRNSDWIDNCNGSWMGFNYQCGMCLVDVGYE